MLTQAHKETAQQVLALHAAELRQARAYACRVYSPSHPRVGEITSELARAEATLEEIKRLPVLLS